jgi:predicted GTPase
MEQMIMNLAGNGVAMAVIIVVVWKRTDEIKQSIQRLWESLDKHKDDDTVHVREKRVDRIERCLNGRLKRTPMEG